MPDPGIKLERRICSYCLNEVCISKTGKLVRHNECKGLLCRHIRTNRNRNELWGVSGNRVCGF